MNNGKKSVLVLAMTAVCGVVLFLSCGFGVFAKDKIPGGAMGKAPTVRNFGYAECEDSSNKFGDELIIPKAKKSKISTGRHYECLSSDEKILYNTIYDVVSNKKYVPYKKATDDKAYKAYRQVYYTGDATFPSRYRTAKEFNAAVNRAEEAIYYDHPDKVEFYMVYATEYGYYKKNGKYQSWLVFVSYEDNTKFASYNSKIKGRLGTIISKIKAQGGGTSWDAYNELIAHDYYCGSYDLLYDDTCKSEEEYFDYSHTAYGSLVDGIAVCDGYAAGFELIMQGLGIPAMIVTGDAGMSFDTGGHAWNIVQLDGNWYEVDTTWDDLSSGVMHDFFNRTTTEYSEEILSCVHKRTAGSSYIGYILPKARGTYWTYDYLCNNLNNYKHDTNVLVSRVDVEDSKVISQGDTALLNVSVFPSNALAKDYLLVSSNPEIVSVTGNAITGVGVGSAIILVSSVDGGISDVCKVYVGMPVGSELSQSGCSFRVTGADTAELIGCSKETVSIPAYFRRDGVLYRVTAVADNAFSGNTKVKEVKGGVNLTRIGTNAFNGCTKLKTVKLAGADIKRIESKAFNKCGALSKLEINGDKLSFVGKKAFNGIKSNAHISILSKNKSKFKNAVKLIKRGGAKQADYKRQQ
ncbi:MAG: hypothetical protein E7302_01720 [Butyrivibrio sp.]|nr:hypothetical protein [Butyrivibrio sp.]